MLCTNAGGVCARSVDSILSAAFRAREGVTAYATYVSCSLAEPRRANDGAQFLRHARGSCVRHLTESDADVRHTSRT